MHFLYLIHSELIPCIELHKAHIVGESQLADELHAREQSTRRLHCHYCVRVRLVLFFFGLRDGDLLVHDNNIVSAGNARDEETFNAERHQNVYLTIALKRSLLKSADHVEYKRKCGDCIQKRWCRPERAQGTLSTRINSYSTVNISTIGFSLCASRQCARNGTSML